TPKATAKPPPGSTPSHPGRVLLRFGVGFGFAVGAPPRCERVGHPFAPGAGAPTGRGWDWLCCRSTASVRTGPAQSTPHACPPSHPGRVLLRVGGGLWFCCRSTAHGANRADTNLRPV